MVEVWILHPRLVARLELPHAAAYTRGLAMPTRTHMGRVPRTCKSAAYHTLTLLLVLLLLLVAPTARAQKQLFGKPTVFHNPKGKMASKLAGVMEGSTSHAHLHEEGAMRTVRHPEHGKQQFVNTVGGQVRLHTPGKPLRGEILKDFKKVNRNTGRRNRRRHWAAGTSLPP